jgi:hypothetical protein
MPWAHAALLRLVYGILDQRDLLLPPARGGDGLLLGVYMKQLYAHTQQIASIEEWRRPVLFLACADALFASFGVAPRSLNANVWQNISHAMLDHRDEIQSWASMRHQSSWWQWVR